MNGVWLPILGRFGKGEPYEGATVIPRIDQSRNAHARPALPARAVVGRTSTGPARRAMGVLGALFILTGVLVVGFPGTAVASTPAPHISLTVPHDPMIGSQLDIGLSFANDAAIAVGYGPFTDLYLPTLGADGASGPPDDGISFVSATYLGLPISSSELTLACDGTDVHPLTGQSITCPPGYAAGDTLVVFELPFGSFTPDQPDAEISVTTQISDLADPGAGLSLTALGGFRHGADPLDNPTTDPPIIQNPAESATVTPTLIAISKTSDASENETATGPDFPRRWTLEVEVAPGQTITDLRVTDLLPDNVIYAGVSGISPGDGVIITEPPGPGPHTGADAEIAVEFPSVTSTAAFDIEWWVPALDVNAGAVLDPTTGASTTVANSASAVGNWTPLDPRDPPGTDNAVADPPEPLNTVTARSIATQKSVTIIDDVGEAGATPGDTLEWTIRTQVSDYFAFADLAIADVLTDGQSMAPATPVRADLDLGQGNVTGADMTHYSTVTVNSPASSGGCSASNPGAIDLDIDLAAAAAALVPASSGYFIGGEVSGSNGATTATVQFRTIIDSGYRCANGAGAVNSRDRIDNSVAVSGDVLDVATLDPTGSTAADESGAGVTIVAPALTKSIYAINGDTTDQGPRITAGDIVTYRLLSTLPLTNIVGTGITDYLPLPTFAIPAGPFGDEISLGPVAPGPFTPTPWSVRLGPTDTFVAATSDVPAVSADHANNAVTVSYGDYTAASGDTPAVADLLINVVADDEPFADGLYLTNQAQLTYNNSLAQSAQLDSIVQVQLTEPELEITKGIVATTNSAGVFTPATTGPAGITWSTPGSPGTRFSGAPLTSGSLATAPIDSNLSNVDAADTVTFAVVVENTGSGLRGAFDVTVADVLPAGLVAPPGGYNVTVTDGNGTALALEAGADLFGAGITLTDDAANNEGALAAADPTSGENVAVITFDARLAANASMAQVLTNTATIDNYSALEGGPDFVTEPLEDTAAISAATPSITKTLTSTSTNPGSPPSVVISGIYGGGGNSGASYSNDFIELTNQGGSAQSLEGWTIRYASASSSTWSPPGTETLGGSIAAGASYLIEIPTTGTTGAGLPSPDDIWGALGSGGLSASSGKVALMSDDTALSGSCPAGATVMDAAGYGSQDCASISVAGAAVLSNTRAAQRNPDRCAAGFVREAPTPQNSAVSPTPCVALPALNTSVAIGGTATYQVEIVVPEGSTSSVTALDRLDAGLAFVSFDSIATNSAALSTDIAGGFPAVRAGVVVTDAGSGPTAPGRDGTFDLGTVTNADTDNNTVEKIVLSYTVAILNVTNNVAGAQRNNSITVQVAGTPVGSAGSSPNVTVAEPAITTTKVANPTTADAGDTVTYTVTVNAANSASASIAHDVALTDALPTGVTYVANSFAHTAGVGPDTISAAGSPVSASWATLAPGQSSAFTLDAEITSAAGGAGPTVTNTVETTYTSLAGAQSPSLSPYNTLAVQRTGEVTDIGGAANTYRRSGSAAVTVNASTITKSLISTSAAHTSGNEVTIGETATYALDVALPEGNLGTVVITDLLPPGMAYVAGSATIDLAGFEGSYTGSPAVPTPTVVGDNVVFGFDNVVVNSGAGTTDNVIRLTLAAQVTDVASNTADHVLANTGRVVVSGTQFNSTPVNLTVVAPALSLTKTFSPDEAAANDTTTVTLELTNTGTSTAYDSTVIDLVDDTVFSAVAPLSTPAGWNAAVIPVTGAHRLSFGAQPGVGLAPGESVTFTATATIASGVAAPASHINSADATATTLDGAVPGERTVTGDGSDTLDLTAVDLVVTKTADVTTAEAGDPITYTITVENVGGRDATGVALSDTLGVNVEYTTASGSHTHSAGLIEWTAFDLAAGATTSRTVTATVVDPMPVGATVTTNSATAHDDGSHGVDPTPTDNTDTATVVLGSVVDLSITKTDHTSTASPGDALTYDVVVTNLGDRNADGATVTDTFDENLTFVSASSGGSYDAGTHSVTWTGVDIEGVNGANTATFTVTARIIDPVPAGVDQVTNSATVEHPDDVEPGNDTDSDVTDIDAEVDLVITKTDGVDSAIPGDTLTYDLVVTNTANRGASGVTVTDTLDPSLTFVSATASGTYDPGTRRVTWSLGVVEVGDVDTLSVTATVNDPLGADVTRIRNTAAVADDGTNGPERNPADNTATDVDLTGADLSITKALEGDTLVPGATATYRIEVTNKGPMTVTEVVINDTMPVELTDPVVEVSEGSIDTDTWSWSGLHLAPGDTVVLTMTLQVDLDSTGTLTNTASVSAPGVGDPNPEVNSAGTTDPVMPVVDLQITKSLSEPLARGEVADWIIEVSNLGPSRATDVTVTDTLPAGLVFAGASGADWVCELDGTSVLHCIHGTPMEPGATSELVVSSTAADDASGVLTNTVEVGATEAESAVTNNSAAASGELAQLPAPSPASPPPSTPDSPSSGGPDGATAPLAFTGSATLPWLLVGFAMIALGVVLRRLRGRLCAVR